MRALVGRAGSPLPVLVDVPDPHPGPGEVVIATTAATVNPIDVRIADGEVREAFGLTGDVGLGWDFSGIVKAVSDDVTGVSVGQRVAALTGNPADPLRAHAELVTVPAGSVAPVPEGMSDAAAASVALNAPTAAMIVDVLGAGAGRSLLVTGAAGAVGGYVLPLAREAGWRVTGLARTTDREFVTTTGADLVTEIEPRAYDAVADAAGLQATAIDAVVDGGAFVGVLPIAPVAAQRGIEPTDVFVQADGVRLAELLRRGHAGDLAVRVAEEVPFSEFARAYALVGQGGLRGRVVLTF